MNFRDKIYLYVQTRGELRCEACGTGIEVAYRRQPELLPIVEHDIGRVFEQLVGTAIVADWSFIEDELGPYLVCGKCHRRPRAFAGAPAEKRSRRSGWTDYKSARLAQLLTLARADELEWDRPDGTASDAAILARALLEADKYINDAKRAAQERGRVTGEPLADWIRRLPP